MSKLKDSMWTEFTQLAIKNNSINLGQGFPDWSPPNFVIESYQKQNNHQYSRSMGNPVLVEEIAKSYEGFRKLDPYKEILVTNGCSGAFELAVQTLISEGDEVMIFQPFYDLYPVQVELAGGIPVYISLKNLNEIPFDELEQKKSKKTKLLILNNPHNPTGKCFTKEELEKLSQFCIKNNIYVISDEVYENMTFYQEHVRIASFPGMFERTLTLCSAGKSFSVTGWKIGWIMGPRDWIEDCYLLNQYNVFCVSTPLQLATAECLKIARSQGYYDEIKESLKTKSQFMYNMLEQVGLKPLKSNSGYFLLCPKENDYDYCHWLPKNVGVSAIPLSKFYEVNHESYLRFCYAKKDETLIEAQNRLFKYFKK